MSDRLNPNEGLTAGNSITSQDGRFTFLMQQDSNLVLYMAGVGPLWASNTVGSNGTQVLMQDDGNLVIYGPNWSPVWASNTDGNPGAWLLAQDDGNVVLYDPNGNPLWATNTTDTIRSNGEKALIVLQENSGQVSLPDNVPPELQSLMFSVIDRLAETFENIKTSLQSAQRYQVVVQLTDTLCTRQNLLDALVEQTRRGRTIDLLVLGHGSSEDLRLNGESLSGGAYGNIRSLLADARGRGCDALRLRTVYMCNCYGSTLNDDWLAIGARAVVGSHQNNYLPEPMTTFFLHNWLAGQDVNAAAQNAYNASVPFWTPIYPPTPVVRYKTVEFEYPCGLEGFPPRVKMCRGTQQVPDGVDMVPHSRFDESRQIVSGDGGLRFDWMYA